MVDSSCKICSQFVYSRDYELELHLIEIINERDPFNLQR